MAVELWTGGDFRYPHERAAAIQIVKNFGQRFGPHADEPVMLVFNTFCNGKEMDLLVFKSDAIIVVDLKDCDKPIRATENGSWRVLTGGELNGNAFRQVGEYRRALMSFLSEHSPEFLRPQKVSQADFEHINGVVAVSPSLHPDTENTIDARFRWFHLVGVDKLDELVGTLSSKKFSFSYDELRTLTESVLKCQRMAAGLIAGSGEPSQSGAGRGKVPESQRATHEVRNEPSKVLDVDPSTSTGIVSPDSDRAAIKPTKAIEPWNIPRRNPFFSGRDAYLVSLNKALTENSGAMLNQPHAINGLGGIGKTQAAIEYAWRYRDRYLAGFWLNPQTPTCSSTSGK